MIQIASEVKAKIDAGLTMCGQNEEGEIEWLGTKEEWRLAEDIQDAIDMDLERPVDN